MNLPALKLKRDFKRLLNTGTKIVSKAFVLFYAHSDSNTSHVGFIAAKKSFPTAVMRNRAKRRLREAVNSAAASMATALDIVVIARHPCLKNNFQKIVDEISQAFKQVS